MARNLTLLAALALAAAPGTAFAQRAGENAVSSADDAFGSSVGLEQTGIYSEQDTRGFSPSKAGNARIDGVYYDPVGALSARLRSANVVRVGFAAQEYPFHAPTGIIEYRLKTDSRPNSAPASATISWPLAASSANGTCGCRSPEIALAFVGGAAQSDLRQSDGASNVAFGFTGRVIARLGDVEIAPFVSTSWFHQNHVRPLTVVTGDTLPKLPEKRRYLGQEWASGHYDNHQFGGVIKAAIMKNLSLRAGLFHAKGNRPENYSEIYSLISTPGETPVLASHTVIADPLHAIHSTSGEAQLAWRVVSGRWQHRFIAGFRARDRLTQTGGSFVQAYADPVPYGVPDPRPQPGFVFGPPNDGRVKQHSFLLGYTGKLDGVGTLNLGIQKARYRGSSRDGRSGVVTRSNDDPWLYNATLGIDLSSAFSIYAGTEKGLEDSGTAPENAANRNEQLPATRSTQYEAGLRWKFPAGQLVVNAFQITKPYFSFDASRAFTRVGQVRHRGVEASLSGHFGKRLQLLAGAVAMQPRVIDRLPGVGERPAGTPSLFARMDVNYRTDIFGGLTPTATLSYTGKRAVGSRSLASLGDRQLMVPGYTALDLGLRQSFKLAKVPMSFRALVWNVFDAKSWKVVGPNSLYLEERRRLNLTVTADF